MNTYTHIYFAIKINFNFNLSLMIFRLWLRGNFIPIGVTHISAKKRAKKLF